MQTTNDPNEWIEWIEEAVSKKFFKYYEYKDFHNKKIIGKGGLWKSLSRKLEKFGTIFRIKIFI
jgi:hypothetical protein